jgi:Family of unknown function (DUF5329)
MQHVMKSWLLILAAVSMCGCSKAVPSKPPAQKPAAFNELPIELTVKQRSNTTVSGSRLRLTVDDITRGQVMVSLADTDGVAVLATTSIRESKSATFTLDGDEYQITLRELDNELVGDDFATFVISRAASTAAAGSAPASSTSSAADTPTENEIRSKEALSEHEKIEQLLVAIENDEGVTFIRNDAEYSPAEAAEHLRTKWAAAGAQIKTAEQFILELASKSSLTGEPYRVRRTDGTIVQASEYLREKLHSIDDEHGAASSSSRFYPAAPGIALRQHEQILAAICIALGSRAVTIRSDLKS